MTTEIRFFALKSKKEEVLDRGHNVFLCEDNNNNIIRFDIQHPHYAIESGTSIKQVILLVVFNFTRIIFFVIQFAALTVYSNIRIASHYIEDFFRMLMKLLYV